jgi:serine/threonine protein kinase
MVNANPLGLDEDQVVEWADQLLSALDYIHQHQLIHRDVKPSNIRRTPDGRIFLVDFGLAKPYSPATPKTLSVIHGLGTPEYSPPEQFDPQAHTDERSDLYALGATLYHLLTGQIPVSVTRRMADPASFQTPRLANRRISPAVESVILHAMEMERAKRYASAAEMRADLQLARQTPTQPTVTSPTVNLPEPASTPLPAPKKRRWPMLGGIGVALIALLLVVWIASRAGTSALAPPPRPVSGATVTITLLSGTTTPEYIMIQNVGDAPRDLSGWYLESVVGPQIFNFPIGFTLNPGQTVRIESGSGATNQPPNVLLWSTDAIWNNSGDKAILRDKTGAPLASQCYGDACP